MSVNRVSFFKWLIQLACAFWLGMLVFLAFGVAGTVFQFVSSRFQAGTLNGIILEKMNILEWICGIVLLVSTGILFFLQKNRWAMLRLAMALVMLTGLFYYSRILPPVMAGLRAKIQNFDIPLNEDPRPERAEFNRLHERYSALVSINAILALTLSFLTATTDSAPRDH
jgi:hypothetical protein